MMPYEATIKGLDAGAASILLELDNGTIKAYHGTDKAILLDVRKVKAGTWNAIWALLENSGKVKYRAKP